METFRYFAIFSFTKVERSVIISYKNGLHELLHNWGHSVITSECWSPFHFCYKMLWKFGGGWDFHSSFVKYQIMFLKLPFSLITWNLTLEFLKSNTVRICDSLSDLLPRGLQRPAARRMPPLSKELGGVLL